MGHEIAKSQLFTDEKRSGFKSRVGEQLPGSALLSTVHYYMLGGLTRRNIRIAKRPTNCFLPSVAKELLAIPSQQKREIGRLLNAAERAGIERVEELRDGGVSIQRLMSHSDVYQKISKRSAELLVSLFSTDS